MTIAVAAALALATAALAPAGSTNLGTTSGLTYMSETTSLGNAPASGSVTATCPGSRRVAGGALGFPSGGTPHVNYSAPAGPGAWTVFAFNGSLDSPSLKAYAICTQSRVKRRSTEISLKRDAAAKGVARCPGGTHVSGGGGAITGAASEAEINSTHPVDGPDSDGKPDDGWSVRAVNLDGSKKEVDVFALCLESKMKYVRSTEQVAGGESWVDQVTCPGGTAATSVGTRISGNAKQARIHQLNLADEPAGADPDSAPDDAGFPTGENLNGDTKAFTAFIACK